MSKTPEGPDDVEWEHGNVLEAWTLDPVQVIAVVVCESLVRPVEVGRRPPPPRGETLEQPSLHLRQVSVVGPEVAGVETPLPTLLIRRLRRPLPLV